MKLQDFRHTVEHILTANYPKRALYVTSLYPRLVLDALQGLDVHQVELIRESPVQDAPESYLERRLAEICKDFHNARKEPSALIINDAVLLARYSISLSPLLSKAISPRSIAILCVPSVSHASVSMSLPNVVDHDFNLPFALLAKQISGQDCTIEE